MVEDVFIYKKVYDRLQRFYTTSLDNRPSKKRTLAYVPRVKNQPLSQVLQVEPYKTRWHVFTRMYTTLVLYQPENQKNHLIHKID